MLSQMYGSNYVGLNVGYLSGFSGRITILRLRILREAISLL